MLQNVYCKATNNFVTISATMPVKEKLSEELQIEFGQWIKTQRNIAGLTQQQVADGADIDRVHLAKIEKGVSGTKRDTAISIAESINKQTKTSHKVNISEVVDRLYGRWDQNKNELTDDELVADGVFSGYYNLPADRQKLARKQIAAIIRSLKDEDFED